MFKYANALKTIGLSITHRNIYQYIGATAGVIRMKIAAELNDKYFCLLVDIATKNKRSILGVNTQCIIDDEIVIRTISMQQITVRHTSENICDQITELLPEYSLEPEQVFSFCGDNAYSMYATGERMDKAASAVDDANDPIFLREDDYEDAILNMYSDCDFYADLIGNVAEKYAHRNKEMHIKTTNTIGCASHTLHLAVEDGIRCTPNIGKLISAVRETVKLLRTPTILNQITAKGLKLPQLDVPTRWNSKYIMVRHMISFVLMNF